MQAHEKEVLCVRTLEKERFVSCGADLQLVLHGVNYEQGKVERLQAIELP